VALLALAVTGRGLVDPDEPVLHADDLALLRAQAAFETLRVYGGRPFRLPEHLARLGTSAERLGLPVLDSAQLADAAALALDAAGGGDCVLRLYWTGGRESCARPVGLALVSPLPEGLEARRARGLKLICLQLALDTRIRTVSPWLLGGVKSTSYAVNMAAEAEARRRGADDALFLSSDGIVLEGPVTNVWWRQGSTLFTPALELGILAGVTRSEVLAAAGSLGYDVEEGRFRLACLAGAEEIFTSSTVREIMPVVELDGRAVADGAPGAAARAVQSALRRAASGSATATARLETR
jgi:4-amino-4-deoxychorismate lyase